MLIENTSQLPGPHTLHGSLGWPRWHEISMWTCKLRAQSRAVNLSTWSISGFCEKHTSCSQTHSWLHTTNKATQSKISDRLCCEPGWSSQGFRPGAMKAWAAAQFVGSKAKGFSTNRTAESTRHLLPKAFLSRKLIHNSEETDSKDIRSTTFGGLHSVCPLDSIHGMTSRDIPRMAALSAECWIPSFQVLQRPLHLCDFFLHKLPWYHAARTLPQHPSTSKRSSHKRRTPASDKMWNAQKTSKNLNSRASLYMENCNQ